MKKEYDFSRGKRGAVIPLPPGKTRITIRLDTEILDWFRAKVHAAGGGSYQTLINDALQEHIAGRREPLVDTLRQVLREERAEYGASLRQKPGRQGAHRRKPAKR
ncbi:MAG: BrnA antitoxin family protein [Acidobacteria bacterium]|nr:BrnA antitoxin family protein [Acidobacteriota bacterium]